MGQHHCLHRRYLRKLKPPNQYAPCLQFTIFTSAAISVYGILISLLNRKLGAFYISAYVSIILLWPYPEEMYRFLHAVMSLLLLHFSVLGARSIYCFIIKNFTANSKPLQTYNIETIKYKHLLLNLNLLLILAISLPALSLIPTIHPAKCPSTN